LFDCNITGILILSYYIWIIPSPSKVSFLALEIDFKWSSVCIRDAELEIRRIINSANQSLFAKKGMNMHLRKGCFTSWVWKKLRINE